MFLPCCPLTLHAKKNNESLSKAGFFSYPSLDKKSGETQSRLKKRITSYLGDLLPCLSSSYDEVINTEKEQTN